ncbi:MAG TPA: hypothetical protein VNM68_01135 [Candidatus Polarisedimenticolia bacterium]|nr:hypothetical protein [Candidatus Polarisedimenticolia bacterium]
MRNLRTLGLMAAASCGLFGGVAPASAPATGSQAQSNPLTTWTVTIVLTPRLVANRPATLAVLGVDGKLAAGVTIDLGSGQRVTTDRTGRAYFTAPASGGVLMAKGPGTSVATLIDPPLPADVPHALTVAPEVSLHEPFSICGAGLRGDADAYEVWINRGPALVLAASPACIVVLPDANAKPGPATISIKAGQSQWTAKTTLVSLEFETPHPPLLPDKKGNLIVRVRGSQQRLGIVVENRTPGVLRFLRGDMQELRTRGGSQNFAKVSVKTIRSGDFSFRARLLPPPDVAAARRYLQAAEPLAPNQTQPGIRKLTDRLAHQPRSLEQVRRELGQIVAHTIPGDCRTLLAAAQSAL